MNCANCHKRIIPCGETKCHYQGYVHTVDKQHTCDWDFNKDNLSARPQTKSYNTPSKK